MRTPDDNDTMAPLEHVADLPAVAEVTWAIVSRFHAAAAPARVAFVAPRSRAGTTTVAAAAAIALAREQQDSVCLIEANIEQPHLARLLGLRADGLTELVEQGGDPFESLQVPSDCPRLSVMTAGARRELATSALTALRWHAILDAISASYRYVLVDAPPILEHMMSRLMIHGCEGAVLVLHTNSTARESAERAQRMMSEAGVPAIGVVLNSYRPGRWLSRSRRAAASSSPAMNGVHEPDESAHAHSMPGFETPPKRSRFVLARKLAFPGKLLPTGSISGEEHRREVEMLERRIAKLSAALKQTEETLQRIIALKDVDSGVASIYRTAQGLAIEDQTRAQKAALLGEIFRANQDLQQAIARRKTSSGPGFEFRIATSGDA